MSLEFTITIHESIRYVVHELGPPT